MYLEKSTNHLESEDEIAAEVAAREQAKRAAVGQGQGQVAGAAQSSTGATRT